LYDGGVELEQGQELLGVLADAAADDDEIRPHEELGEAQVVLQPRDPLSPGQAFLRASGTRGPRAAVDAVDAEVAEFRVGEQPPVEEKGRADPRTQRHHQRDPLGASTRAERHLGESGRIGVVEDGHRGSECLGEQVGRVRTDPARVDVGRVPYDSVPHDRREGDADGGRCG